MERTSIHGVVTLRICVSKKGKATSISALDGNPMAVGAVIESVKDWKFKPYRVNGYVQNVVADLEVDYDFRSQN